MARRGDGAAGEPIIRRSLHDELLERLRKMIMNGELRPGSKVPEKELCQRFGVSRTPLREALKVLASEGLVTLTPNRGAMISDLTLEDLEEAFPVMGALEALSGEMACANISEAELDEIRSLHARMIAHYEARELEPYFATNQRIHEVILHAAGNRTLISLYRSLEGRVRQARFLANMSEERWAQAVAEHRDILTALEARDGSRLARILKSHLANKFETVKEALANRAESNGLDG
ncbi:MAG: GntR family transcriptional regulator [Alphaproteobacteria bacterium]|nr:MAG: GntR family transcriptional regulator [Alphaproteobacteria bacterium]